MLAGAELLATGAATGGEYAGGVYDGAWTGEAPASGMEMKRLLVEPDPREPPLLPLRPLGAEPEDLPPELLGGEYEPRPLEVPRDPPTASPPLRVRPLFPEPTLDPLFVVPTVSLPPLVVLLAGGA